MNEIKFTLSRDLTAEEAMLVYPLADQAKVMVTNFRKSWVVAGRDAGRIAKFMFLLGQVDWFPKVTRIAQI